MYMYVLLSCSVHSGKLTRKVRRCWTTGKVLQGDCSQLHVGVNVNTAISTLLCDHVINRLTSPAIKPSKSVYGNQVFVNHNQVCRTPTWSRLYPRISKEFLSRSPWGFLCPPPLRGTCLFPTKRNTSLAKRFYQDMLTCTPASNPRSSYVMICYFYNQFDLASPFLQIIQSWHHGRGRIHCLASSGADGSMTQ